MIVTPFTREALAVRREQLVMERAGYRKCEPFWEIHRGAFLERRIVDVKISCDGRYVWAKLDVPLEPKAEGETNG